MKDQEEKKQVPTRENNVIDHSAKSLDEAVGVTYADTTEVAERINKGIIESFEKNNTKVSHVIEQMIKNTTHKELAVLFYAYKKQQEAASGIDDFVSQLISK